MKNDSINNKVNNVPSIQTGCSMAETGWNEYDDFNKPLKEFDIIPKGKEIPFVKTEASYRADGEDYVDIDFKLPPEMENPSSVREETLVTVTVPHGIHPYTYLKEKGIDVSQAWVFVHKDVVEVLRKLPYRFHQETVAYGEFFRFENFDTISLQTVKYFSNWKVILEGKIDEGCFFRPYIPKTIVEVVMEK